MCADTYSTLGSAYNLGNFRVWPFLKPMKLHHLSLAAGKLFEGHVKELGALAQLQRHEIRFRGGLGLDLQAGHLASLRSTPVLTDEVHRDGHDPWAQLRAAPEVVSRAVKTEKSLLNDLFGQLVVAKMTSSEAKKDGRVPFEQESKRSIVPIDVCIHQLFVGPFGLGCATRHVLRRGRGPRGASCRLSRAASPTSNPRTGGCPRGSRAG